VSPPTSPSWRAPIPTSFGLALATLDGALYEAGHARHPFTIQSVSKPFVLALAIEDRGLDALLSAVGVEPTGDPFNAVTLEPGTGRPLNPMVNAGAIVTSNLVHGDDPKSRIDRITQACPRSPRAPSQSTSGYSPRSWPRPTATARSPT
jgi:glutaminase